MPNIMRFANIWGRVCWRISSCFVCKKKRLFWLLEDTETTKLLAATPTWQESSQSFDLL